VESFYDIGAAIEDVGAAAEMTRAQGLEVLALCDKTLATADGLVASTSLVATLAHLRPALRDRIAQVRGYVAKVRAELARVPEGPLAALLANKVKLATKQAAKTLADTDKAVSGTNAPLLPDFLEAMKQILAGLALATPPWVWAIGVGLLGVAGVAMLTRGRR
jgi:hypothetical protein